MPAWCRRFRKAGGNSMNAIYLFGLCGLVVIVLTALLVSAVCVGKVKENRRRNQLGKLLKCSHPEWN